MNREMLSLTYLVLGVTILVWGVSLAGLLRVPPVGGVTLPTVLRLCSVACLVAGCLLLAGRREAAAEASRLGLTLVLTFLLGVAGRGPGGGTRRRCTPHPYSHLAPRSGARQEASAGRPRFIGLSIGERRISGCIAATTTIPECDRPAIGHAAGQSPQDCDTRSRDGGRWVRA